MIYFNDEYCSDSILFSEGNLTKKLLLPDPVEETPYLFDISRIGSVFHTYSSLRWKNLP